MTDTYVEEILTEKFKEVKNLTTTKTVRTNDDGSTKTVVTYLDVAFPNIAFTRPDSGYWYELYFIPSRPVQMELGFDGRNRWVGVMQVNICVPKSSGTQALNSRFDEVARVFRQGSMIEHVRISEVHRDSAIDDDDYYVLPVSISWWSDLYR